MLDYEQGKGIGSSSRHGISAANDRHREDRSCSACEPIRTLVSGCDPDIRRRRRFLILQVALDESGYEASRTDDVFVFAGYIGTEPQWTDFTHKWADIFIRHPEVRDAPTFKKLVRWCGRWSDPRAVEMIQAIGDSGL